MPQKMSIPLKEKIKSIPGIFGIRLYENPPHKILKQETDFEVRKYSELLVAKTLIASTYEVSSKSSFKRLAGYLFGGNQTHKRMSMTAPVFIENKSGGWLMTFVLPKQLDFDSLPIPEDKQVEVTTEPSKKWAVMKYTGFPNEEVMKQMAAKLSSAIKKTSQYRVISEPRWAQYDGPMVLPFLRLNEVQIQVETIQ